MGPLFSRGVSVVICAGFATGSGFSSSEFTRLKTAVLAPMPRAMVRIAVIAKLGDRPTWRRANRKSCIKVRMRVSVEQGNLQQAMHVRGQSLGGTSHLFRSVVRDPRLRCRVL